MRISGTLDVAKPPHPDHRHAMIRPLPARGERCEEKRTAFFHLSPPAGRGRIALAIRVRGRLSKGSGDRFKDARHVAQHVVVPKSQDAIVAVDKPFVANRVARVIRVLTTINFNDETEFTANQVDRIGTDRLLPNEFETLEPSRPKAIPQRCFGICGCLTQTSGSSGFDLISLSHVETPPHPDHRQAMIRPLPARGERSASRELP
jgi:hypothetical protein